MNTGVIAGSGTFNGTVVNEDKITGGTFYGPVANYKGPRHGDREISGGTFYGPVANGYNYIDPDSGEIPGEGKEGLITNGTFYGEVTNAFFSKISGGSFYGKVDNRKRTEYNPTYQGILAGGTFYAGNPGTVANGCCTVTYEYGKLDGIYAKQIVQAGETAIRPDDPTKTGYIFAGWELGDTKYNFAAPVTENMTLTAKWTVCDHKGSTAQPTCTTPAICTACGGTLAALGHDWGPWTSGGNNTHTRACKRDGTHTETENCHGGTATCKDKAKCAICGKTYGELDAKNHADLKHIPAKAATRTAEGNIEYWHCDGCNKYYSDKGGAKEIKKADTVTAKLKGGSTTAKQEDGSKSPGTGDTSSLALWSALLFVSGGAAIGTTVVRGRKKYNR